MAGQARPQKRDDSCDATEESPIARSTDKPAKGKDQRACEPGGIQKEPDDARLCRDLQKVVVGVLRTVSPGELRREEVGRVAKVAPRSDAEIRMRTDHAEARHDELLSEPRRRVC